VRHRPLSRLAVALAVLLLLTSLVSPVLDGRAATRAVVRLRDVRALPRIGPVRAVLTTDTFVVDVPPGRDLAADPDVVWAAADVRYRAARQPNDPCWAFCPAALRGQEDLQAVHAAEAWAVTTGSPSIVVAVIDGAVQADHPDLAGNVQVGPDLVVDGCTDAPDPFARSHGTAVAGVVAARTDNGLGVAALGWNTKVLAIRVLDDCGWGEASAVAAGIRYAVRAGVRVINLSMTGPAHPAVEEALAAAHRAGAVVVAAAGNDGSSVPAYPAAYPDVLAVGATDPTGTQPAPFSNRGSWVDLAAPGQAVASTSTLPGGYWMYDGTSFSSPLVAGAAALVLAVHPHFDPDDVAAALARSSRATPALSGRTRWGVLDAGELVTPHTGGAWIATATGAVRAYGDAASLGSAAGLDLRRPVVGIASVPGGYLLAAADGGVFAFGRARFAGSLAGRPLQRPIVGIAATPSGRGYWLVAADGGVFAFGDAPFVGSAAPHLRSPAVAIAATPSGRGYVVLARDGGVFAFGDAGFAGSLAGRPVGTVTAIAMARRAAYWVTTADGGVFAFGGAPLHGSARDVDGRVVGMAAGTGGSGYWLVTDGGRPMAFGDVPDDGRLVPAPAAAVVGIALAR
jgi:subtilisin family serine protease